MLAAWALLSGGLVWGALKAEVSTDYRIFFSRQDPRLAALLSVEQVFTKTDNIAFIVRPKQGEVFTPDALAAIQELTRAGWKLPFASRVDSLTNFQVSRADGDTLTVSDLVGTAAAELTPDDLARIRATAVSEPLLYGLLLAKDAQAAGVNITLRLPQKDPTEVNLAAAAARTLLAEVSARHPGLEVRASGMALMNDAFMETSLKDMSFVFPLMGLVIFLALALILRSGFATACVSLIVGLSGVATVAIAGIFNFPLTPPSAAAPTIVLTLAVADSVHIALAVGAGMRKGLGQEDAIREAIRLNLKPMIMTASTTMFGFLGLDFAAAPPMWHLANMTTLGIGLAFLASITLLPALLSLRPLTIPEEREIGQRFMHKLGDLVVAQRWPLIVGGIGLSVALGAVAFSLESNDQFLQYFDRSVPFRADTEYFLDHLTGIYTVDYQVGSAGPSEVTNPEYLRMLDGFVTFLRAQPEVKHVYGITDILKRVNQSLHHDDPTEYGLPGSQELASQYLLLYELSLPFGLDLTDRVNLDKSATRVTVTLGDLSSNQLRAFADRTEGWLHQHAPKESWTHAISPAVIFSHLSVENSRSMMQGNLFTLLLVSAGMILTLRSFRLGIISLIPNLMPIAIAYGVWAIFVGEVNICASAAGSIALGIVVDDTIYSLHKYQLARAHGESNEQAVRGMLNGVGPSVIATALVLLAGFGVLILSGFQMTNYLGLLVMLVLGPGLLADLFVLPPLMLVFDENFFRRAAPRLVGVEVAPAKVGES